MQESIRYVVFKVVVKHEPKANVMEICKAAEVFADDTQGEIDKSEVVGVYEKQPTGELV